MTDITRTYSPRDEDFVEDRFEIVLPPLPRAYDVGAVPTLTIIVTPEGVIMDAYKADEHRGTIGMTYEEWWEFIANG
tara:strand:- start:2894 stop:3124 length:231 start_codon:yes stop_codon:yes gene_type:complete